MTDLETLSYEIEKKGKIWIEAKQIAERYEELKKTILAEIQNNTESYNTGKELSESKLKRLAEGSDMYKAHIEEMCAAKKNASVAYIEYEALKNLFEAKRSDQSFEKAKLQLI